MPYTYLLDTNIVSDLMRHPAGQVYQQILEVGEESICTSVVVACELRFGVEKRGSAQLKQRLDNVLKIIPIIPLASPVEIYYASTRTYLEKQGMPIGPNDLLIACHALALDLTVVTDNLREFARVPKLKLQNWLLRN